MLKPIKLTAIACLFAAACQQPSTAPKEVLRYFADGEVSRRHFEINGKKQGPMTDYYPGGKVRSERMFKNDQQVGRTVFYYPHGQIMETQFFDENGLKQGGDSTFYENGNLQLLLNFKDGKKHGYLQKWSTIGELVYEARYEMEDLVEVNGERLQ